MSSTSATSASHQRRQHTDVSCVTVLLTYLHVTVPYELHARQRSGALHTSPPVAHTPCAKDLSSLGARRRLGHTAHQ